VAGECDGFTDDVAQLRERYRQRPTLIAVLDKANTPEHAS
jgi:hypothetical protein